MCSWAAPVDVDSVVVAALVSHNNRAIPVGVDVVVVVVVGVLLLVRVVVDDVVVVTLFRHGTLFLSFAEPCRREKKKRTMLLRGVALHSTPLQFTSKARFCAFAHCPLPPPPERSAPLLIFFRLVSAGSAGALEKGRKWRVFCFS